MPQCSYFSKCFLVSKDCKKKNFYGDMGSPSNFLGVGQKNYVNFQKSHFIVYTYFCNFPLPRYSAVSILSNNL